MDEVELRIIRQKQLILRQRAAQSAPAPQAEGFGLRPFKPGEKVDNADGSYSTERTVTVQGPDGQWSVVPSLWMGPNGPVDLLEKGDDVIANVAARYEAGSGEKFPRFADVKAAEDWAVQRSASGGASGGGLASGISSQTNIAEQAGSGINEGIANALGLPVDVVTSVFNLAAKAVGVAPIDRPVGGSESIKGALDPFISDVAPENAGQRFARRVGQEVGAGAVTGPAMGVRTAGGLALNAMADTGAGVAAAGAREVTDNPWVEMGASMVGGVGAVAAARAIRPGPQAPTRGDLKRTQGDAYDVVDASTARLTPQATGDLVSRVEQRLANEGIDPYLHPKASRTMERLRDLDQPTIGQVEQRRRLVSRDVAGSMEPSERRLGQIMKDEIDAYLDGLTPGHVTGGNAEEAVDALHVGRDATVKIKRDEMLATASEKAERRAATSGTGGNVINTTRQNLRAILDDPKKARMFTGDERAAIEEIVMGSPGANAARLLGRLAPRSGALPLVSGMGQMAGAVATGNPFIAAPMIVGEIARAMGETLTERQLVKLSDAVRNGGVLPAKGFTSDEVRVLGAVLAAQAASATGGEQ